MKEIGKQNGYCPYYFARQVISRANIVVYSYTYLLDPTISNLVGKDMESDCVVVFDEAHNIDDVCIEVFSIKINRAVLEGANKNLEMLKGRIENTKDINKKEVEKQYLSLIKGMKAKGTIITPDMNLEADSEKVVEGNLQFEKLNDLIMLSNVEGSYSSKYQKS